MRQTLPAIVEASSSNKGSGAMVRVSSASSPADRGREARSRTKATEAYVRAHCPRHVSEEWTKVDDKKLAKLRGILSALKEENQSTQMLRRESEESHASDALKAARDSTNTRLAKCKLQEAQFLRDQEQLRQRILDHEKVLQETETTIEKGMKRCRDEQQECRRLDNEIRDLQSELQHQEQAKELVVKHIQKTAQYQQFLELTSQCEPEYDGDVELLMNRHSTLEAGNHELHKQNATLSMELDELREKLVRLQTTLQTEHLMFSSQLQECESTLEAFRAKNRELEQQLNRSLETKELKESEVGVIQMAIEQLFTRTWQTCRQPNRKKAMQDNIDIKHVPVLKGDKAEARLEAMLREVIERMEDLVDMNIKATEMLPQDTVTQAAAVSEGGPTVEFVFTQSETGSQQVSESFANSAGASLNFNLCSFE